eukprot:582036-Pleurochrysis_carterae.AAC.1
MSDGWAEAYLLAGLLTRRLHNKARDLEGIASVRFSFHVPMLLGCVLRTLCARRFRHSHGFARGPRGVLLSIFARNAHTYTRSVAAVLINLASQKRSSSDSSTLDLTFSDLGNESECTCNAEWISSLAMNGRLGV